MIMTRRRKRRRRSSMLHGMLAWIATTSTTCFYCVGVNGFGLLFQQTATSLPPPSLYWQQSSRQHRQLQQRRLRQQQQQDSFFALFYSYSSQPNNHHHHHHHIDPTVSLVNNNVHSSNQHQQRNDTAKLLSYLSNLQRVRRRSTVDNNDDDVSLVVKPEEEEDCEADESEEAAAAAAAAVALFYSNNQHLIKLPARSLAKFLEEHEYYSHDDDDDDDNQHTINSNIQEHDEEEEEEEQTRQRRKRRLVDEDILSRTLVQAIRLAASVNDYRLLLRLVHAAQHYATGISSSINSSNDVMDNNYEQQQQQQLPPPQQRPPLLQARILGEAIRGLTQTSASIGKIRTLWRNCTSTTTTSSYSGENENGRTSTGFQPVTAVEVNAYITALTQRGKTRAALRVMEYHGPTATNAYSYSLVLKALQASIVNNQDPLVNINHGPIWSTHVSFLDKNSSTIGNTADATIEQLPWYTVCWQWNEAVRLLERCLFTSSSSSSLSLLRDNWNNHVLAALLQLNLRAGQVFTAPQQHDASALALQILYFLQYTNYIQPDVVTCTLITSTLSGQEWPRAVQLLQEMQNQNHNRKKDSGNNNLDDMTEHNNNNSFGLPSPNIYAYAATMACCARGQEYKTCLKLLDKLRKKKTTDNNIKPNTVVYNTILQALLMSSNGSNNSQNSSSSSKTSIVRTAALGNKRHSFKALPFPSSTTRTTSTLLIRPWQRNAAMKRLRTALQLLVRMMKDSESSSSGFDATSSSPDIITFHTLLAILASTAAWMDDVDNLDDWQVLEQDFESLFGYKSSSSSISTSNNTTVSSSSANSNGGSSSDQQQQHIWTHKERLTHTLLDIMEDLGIIRDSWTYRQALLVVRCNGILPIVKVLGRAIKDDNARQISKNNPKHHHHHHHHHIPPAATTDVFNCALAALAEQGDVDGMQLVLSKMARRSSTTTSTASAAGTAAANTTPNRLTTVHVINTLARANKTASIPVLLLAMTRNQNAAMHLFRVHGLNNIPLESLAPLEAVHYSTAITSSLLANDGTSARRVLAQMQDLRIETTDSTLEAIARTYALVALSSSAAASSSTIFTKIRTRKDLSSWRRQQTQRLKEDSSSQEKAQSAYSIVRDHLSKPTPLYLQSLVARACAATGLFPLAQCILRSMHKSILNQRNMASVAVMAATGVVDRNGDDWMSVTAGLHRSLLESCADWGNVTAALDLVEDIQWLNRQLQLSSFSSSSSSYLDKNRFVASPPAGVSVIRWSEVNSDGEVTKPLFHLTGRPLAANDVIDDDDKKIANIVDDGGLGMKAPEWKSLLVAASKSGHWRVCLSTLQFLRPYMQCTHPSRASLKPELQKLNREYTRLSSALSWAVTCMSIRSQYGWAVRAIDDWIDWSGRRPPKDAVAAAFRILSARGRGEEVYSLLTRCTLPRSTNLLRDGKTYELSLHVNAIVALYKEGLYDAADDIFVAAIANGAIPFNLEKSTVISGSAEREKQQRITLDLHGMNVAVAHSAVRIALQQEILFASWDKSTSITKQQQQQQPQQQYSWEHDMIIVTGRGKKSTLSMRPVLRPEVQRMLVEEFYPPLGTTSIPGNLGAIRVSSSDIDKWLRHQRQQKGARMLSVAAVLKNLSSGNRLFAALTQAAANNKVDDSTKRNETNQEESNP